MLGYRQQPAGHQDRNGTNPELISVLGMLRYRQQPAGHQPGHQLGQEGQSLWFWPRQWAYFYHSCFICVLGIKATHLLWVVWAA